MAKEVSSKFVNIMDNDIVKKILDRKSDITDVIDEVLSWWSYDLYSRKPGPAYLDDGTFVGTDLDLACFLYELAKRYAVINIPEYDAFTQTKFKTGQTLVSKDNRHGKIISLLSNQYTWVFSVRMIDYNVMTTDQVGDFRTFSLTDFKGDWYDGWSNIEFVQTAKENEWLNESQILTGNKIQFKQFIHPNRWTSFFGEKYFITKLLIERMSEEASHSFDQIKKMLDSGIRYPSSGGDYRKSFTDSNVDAGQQITVKAFEVELDVPPNETSFPEYPHTQDNLVMLTKRRNDFVYGSVTKLKFMTRATEYAHYTNPDRFPGWIKGAEWVHNYKQPGKRKLWSRLILCQPEYFKTGVAIRKREWDKSIRVSEHFNAGE